MAVTITSSPKRRRKSMMESHLSKDISCQIPIIVTIIVVVCVLWSSSASMIVLDIYSNPSIQDLAIGPETQKATSGMMFPFRRTVYLCASTQHLFSGNVTAAVFAAEDFHMHGGNLKAIQNYLDQQIDPTYRQLGVHFETSSGKRIQQGIPKFIHDELVKGDTGSRGGYDQRKLPGRFHPPNRVIDTRRIDVMEENNFDKWEAALGPIGPNCTSVDRIQQRDKKHYEDKFMCSYHNLSSTRSTNDEECDILSIGSNDQWGFESTILKHAPHCRTHTFDCTLTTPKNKPQSPNVTFYSVCIAGENRDDNTTGRTYRTYDDLWKMTGMKGPPRLLKIDVEGFEYDVLTSMMPRTSQGPRDDHHHHHLPEQIVVELHYSSRMYDLSWMLRSRQAAEISMLISHMYRAGGYMPVYVDYDPGCAPCLEVLFVKVLCNDIALE